MFAPTLIVCALAVATAAQTVERPAYGLRLELPDGWKALDDALQGESLRLLLVREPAAQDERLALRVFPSAAVGDASSARGLAEAAVANGPGYAAVESFTISLLGEERIAFGVDVVSQTPPLHLRQVYVEHGKWLLILESVAPVDGFDARWTEFARVWSGLERFEPVPDDPERARLEALAARCGEDVRWASSWEVAASRARVEQKPVLVMLHLYRGFQLSDETLSSIFMQRAWIELVNTRFVPLRATSLTGLPFASFDSYGLSATTFGATWLVVTPEGEVVGDHAFPVYDDLVRNLDALGDLTGDPVTAEDPVQRALALAARGELAHAAAALDVAMSVAGDARDPAAVLALAEMRLRMRDGAGVLDVLADLETSDLEAAPLRIEALIGLGRFDDARAAVDALQERYGELDGGVPLWLGVLAWRHGDRERAEALLRRTTLEHPEQRSAWIAAAVLLGTSWGADVVPGFAWPAREDLDELRRPTYAPLPVQRAAAARDATAAWLLGHQRADGLWFEPMAAGRDARRAPQDFQLATSALALRALLREPRSLERDAALERGTRAVLDGLRAQRIEGIEALFMDYAVWSRACMIDLVAELLDASRLAHDEAQSLVSSMRDELAERVQQNGGWSYYLTTDPGSDAAPAAQSISFTTAAVTLALMRARERDLAAGDALDALIDGGLDCLEAMRDADGRFAYMQFSDVFRAPDVARTGDVAAPGAAGRGPVCTLALLRGGRVRQADLERSLSEFVACRGGLRREIGRALMHTGSDGQGSHYVMWDYAMAAEAVEELPRRGRARYRDALLEELLQARLDDGAFLGSPLLGRAHGAAEALRAFAHLGI